MLITLGYPPRHVNPSLEEGDWTYRGGRVPLNSDDFYAINLDHQFATADVRVQKGGTLFRVAERTAQTPGYCFAIARIAQINMQHRGSIDKLWTIVPGGALHRVHQVPKVPDRLVGLKTRVIGVCGLVPDY